MTINWFIAAAATLNLGGAYWEFAHGNYLLTTVYLSYAIAAYCLSVI